MERAAGLLVLVGLFALAGGIARGAEAPGGAEDAAGGGGEAGDLFAMDLDELLDVKVKVASRREETTLDAPSSVTVFTRQEIQSMGLRYLEELLNFVPGFSCARTEFIGQEWAMSTRGFWGVSDPAILLLIDGMRINEHFSGSFGLLERLVSLDAVERVEVIRGPGSALYGSNAFYGVINVVTSRSLNEVVAEAGNLAARRVAASLSHRFGESVLAGSVGFFEDGGERYGDVFDGRGLSDETRDPREGRDAYLSFERSRFRIHARHERRDFRDFYLLGNKDDGHLKFEAVGTGLFASYRLSESPRFRAELSGSYEDWSSEGGGRFSLGGPRGEGDYILFVVHETRVANLSLDVTSELGDHVLSYGATHEYANNPQAHQISNYDVTDGSYLGRLVEQRDDESRFVTDDARNISGLYLQDRFRAGDRVTLIGGLRFDHYSDFGSTVNPRAAAIWRPIEGSTLKLMYGEAFVAPSMEKLHIKSNPFEVMNPDLDPQEIRTVELAYTQELSKLQATLTLFHNRETELFGLGTNPDGSYSTVNAGSNSSRGAELEIAASLSEHVLVRGAVARVFEGERAEAFPTVASLVVNLSWQDLNVNINGYYRSAAEALPAQGAYALANLAVGYRVKGGLSLQLVARNLLDEDYLTYTRNIDHELPNRGRELSLLARYAF